MRNSKIPVIIIVLLFIGISTLFAWTYLMDKDRADEIPDTAWDSHISEREIIITLERDEKIRQDRLTLILSNSSQETHISKLSSTNHRRIKKPFAGEFVSPGDSIVLSKATKGNETIELRWSNSGKQGLLFSTKYSSSGYTSNSSDS